MNKFDACFSNRPVLFDGGLGSALIAAGLPRGTPPESWTVEQPEIVQGVHRAYYQAGADVVQTNTFGANQSRLAETRCPYPLETLNREAVRLVREVCPEGKLICGEMGPSGMWFPPRGKADPSHIEDLAAEQATLLAGAGVDLLCLETFSDLREARAALCGVKRVTALPVVVSMTFRATPQGYFTLMGDPLRESLGALLDQGAYMAGINCTLSAREMVELTHKARGVVMGHLLIQPNAGNPTLVAQGDGHVLCYPEGPEAFARHMKEIIATGVDAVGGCCGTTPAHVALLAQLVRAARG